MLKNYKKLRIWQKSYQLCLVIYKETSKFPKEERFGLISQMRRAAVSITSNIAEGFGRIHPKEKLNFYIYAKSSLIELENQYIIAKDVSYIKKEEYENTTNIILSVAKPLGALITKTRKKIPQ